MQYLKKNPCLDQYQKTFSIYFCLDLRTSSSTSTLTPFAYYTIVELHSLTCQHLGFPVSCLEETVFSPLYILCTRGSVSQWETHRSVSFWSWSSASLVYMSFFLMSVSCWFAPMALWSVLRSGNMIPLSLCLLLKTSSGLWGLLRFHLIPISRKKSYCNFDKVYTISIHHCR